MFARLGGFGTLALLFVVGCVVATVHQGTALPAILAVPGLIYVLFLLFRPANA